MAKVNKTSHYEPGQRHHPPARCVTLRAVTAIPPPLWPKPQMVAGQPLVAAARGPPGANNYPRVRGEETRCSARAGKALLPPAGGFMPCFSL